MFTQAWLISFVSIVRCENGKIFLPLTGHDAVKSLTSFKDATTAGMLEKHQLY